jgi:thiol-disulfide isomerase/thioredoxin
MRRITIILLLVFSPSMVLSQNIKGEFSNLPNQPLKLMGYNNFETYVIDSTQTDSEGQFSLNYSNKDYGMGYLKSTGEQKFYVALSDETSILNGTDFEDMDALDIQKGSENKSMYQYALTQPKRDQVLSAWHYLDKMYKESGDIFKGHLSAKKAIANEIGLLEEEAEAFIANMPEDQYMKWYLPLRSLLSSVGNVARNRPERITTTLIELRAIDYTEERLSKSGLLYDAIFNHVWFIENSSGPLGQVFKDLNLSIDIMADQLKNNDERFNLVMEKMFEIMEERSLFSSSEYLAEKLLQSDDCGCLNPQLQKKLERYGKMAKGQTAPDIEFSNYTYYPEGVSAKSLKSLEADYKLVVFAAGWCPHCRESMPKIEENYKHWKDKGVEVVFVSLDENPKDFASFAGPLPFVSTTDYKKWEGKAVKDYQVYATPSYFMLDKDLKILIRPKSVEHAKAWIETYVN